MKYTKLQIEQLKIAAGSGDCGAEDCSYCAAYKGSRYIGCKENAQRILASLKKRKRKTPLLYRALKYSAKLPHTAWLAGYRACRRDMRK